MANNQIHISGDVSYAIQMFFAVTNDVKWMKKEGCAIALEVAKFWESRCEYDEQFDLFDINRVMGPDEDHASVDNNVFTNVVASYSLKLGS